MLKGTLQAKVPKILKPGIACSGRKHPSSGFTYDDGQSDGSNPDEEEARETWEGWGAGQIITQNSFGLKKQIEKRMQARNDNFKHMLENVSATEFMQEERVGIGRIPAAADLQLTGAIPPVSDTRMDDRRRGVAQQHSESQAAVQHITLVKQQSLLQNRSMAKKVRESVSKTHAVWGASTQALDYSEPPTNAPSPATVPPSPSTSAASTSRGPSPLLGCSPTPLPEEDEQEVDDIASTEAGRPGSSIASPSEAPASEASEPWGLPFGKAFDYDVAAFHREVEKRENDHSMVVRLRQQQLEQQSKKEYVSRCNFEKKHKQREKAIVTELKRRKARNDFDEKHVVRTKEALQKRRQEEEVERQRIKDSIAEEKVLRAARKQKQTLCMQFRERRGVLERGCLQGDHYEHKDQHQNYKEYVNDCRKHEWERRAATLENRWRLCKAQKRYQDDEYDRRLYFMWARRQHEDREEAEKRTAHVQAQRDIALMKQYAREALAEPSVASRSLDATADAALDAAAPEAFQSYQQTLGAFSDMAKGLQKYTKKAAARAMFYDDDESLLIEDALDALDEAASQPHSRTDSPTRSHSRTAKSRPSSRVGSYPSPEALGAVPADGDTSHGGSTAELARHSSYYLPDNHSEHEVQPLNPLEPDVLNILKVRQTSGGDDGQGWYFLLPEEQEMQPITGLEQGPSIPVTGTASSHLPDVSVRQIAANVMGARPERPRDIPEAPFSARKLVSLSDQVQQVLHPAGRAGQRPGSQSARGPGEALHIAKVQNLSLSAVRRVRRTGSLQRRSLIAA
eukprot:TRINITY_DN49556_c0_g1_i1.p1 TRINITY_DN49556_c0_g1~~TRINITY_DN49556_c0_g1_i1.p1  ORF type:complete len:795 (-),score=161.69 TRINITY_DN49556_c0_g1_i1:141-2525(-)